MNLRQAAQQALEAMDKATRFMSDSDYKKLNQAIDALRAALAEPQTTHWEGCEAVHPECRKTEQEPDGISWLKRDSGYFTAPIPRKPVELTDEEILDANYADGEEADPIIAAPDSELIAFSRAVMAVQRDKEGKPMAHWHGLIEPQKDAAAFAPRKPLTDEEMRECAQAMNAEPLAEGWPELIKFARAIENKHGIGEQHE